METIRLYSDFHLEKGYDDIIPVLEDEENQILVLAGDMDSETHSLIDFIEIMCSRFKYVIFVAGNHDYWMRPIFEVDDVLTWAQADHPNFKYLNSDTFESDDYIFVGHTLWYQLQKDSKLADRISERLYDFKMIRTKYNYEEDNLLTMEDVLSYNATARQFFEDKAKEYFFREKKLVAISHHSPSLELVPNRWFYNLFNPAFHNVGMDHIVKQYDIWLYGHIHESQYKKIGSCETYCNCRGHINGPDREVPGFRESGLLEEIGVIINEHWLQ